MNWKPLAGGALLVGYAVTFLVGVPATRSAFIDAWANHRIGAAILDGHAPIPPEERAELRYYAEDIVCVERVIPILPCVLMVEYDEDFRDCGVRARALVFWFPGTTRLIVDAG